MASRLEQLAECVDEFREWERTHNRENYGRYDAFKAGRLAGLRAGIQMSATACILSDWQREGDFGIADGADRARNNVLALLRDTPALA